MAVECPIVLTKDLGSPLFLSLITTVQDEDNLDASIPFFNTIWETVFFPRISPRYSRVPHLWPGGTSLEDADGLAGLLLLFTSIVFGAIHCLGWNFYYPTRAEALIWQVGSALATGGPFFVCLIFFTALSIESLINIDFYDSCFEFRYIDFVCTFVGVFFVAARLVLLILPFVLLRDLPSAAFDTVSWTRFIPHVSSGIQ